MMQARLLKLALFILNSFYIKMLPLQWEEKNQDYQIILHERTRSSWPQDGVILADFCGFWIFSKQN